MNGLESLNKLVKIYIKKKKDKNDGRIACECLDQIKNELKDYYRLVSRMKFGSRNYKNEINSKRFQRETKTNKYITYNLNNITDVYLFYVDDKLKDEISDTYWEDNRIYKK